MNVAEKIQLIRCARHAILNHPLCAGLTSGKGRSIITVKPEIAAILGTDGFESSYDKGELLNCLLSGFDMLERIRLKMVEINSQNQENNVEKIVDGI